jgi:hypothetical protein
MKKISAKLTGTKKIKPNTNTNPTYKLGQKNRFQVDHAKHKPCQVQLDIFAETSVANHHTLDTTESILVDCVSTTWYHTWDKHQTGCAYFKKIIEDRDYNCRKHNSKVQLIVT